MSGSESRDKDSVTEVAGQAFIRERAPEIERGTVLAGRYQIEDIIGKGGSGVVLRVFDRVAQNVVALKVLKTELARDAKWEKRFSRELRLGRPIQHPNVCRIFDIGEAEGYRFLTMELAAGGSLRDELKRKRASERSLEERVGDAKGVIDGLAALHSAGVVHRDFKPDNILRMNDGRLVLSDFGLATDAANAPGATVLIGTPHYMAPEVLAGEPATSRSDVWALGVVLHEIFFGQRPERRSVSFDGSGRAPLRPTTARERSILVLCERCLADTPLDRPEDAVVASRMFEHTRLSAGRRKKRHLTRRIPYAFAAIALAWLAGWAVRRGHQGGVAIRSDPHVTVLQPKPTGPLTDWTNTAEVVGEVSGQVHCFSLVNENTARLVWGTPRHAQDYDLKTGRHRDADLDPAVYRIGCPDLAPDGHALLFTGQSAAGATEIRLSESGDGRQARVVTSGAEPQWLGRSDSFSYEIDSSHAAIFSLPTATLTLMPEPTFGDHRMILQKAVNRIGSAIALLVGNDKSEYAIAVYQGPTFGAPRVFQIPSKDRIQFGTDDDQVLVSYRQEGQTAALASLDWRRIRMTNLGFYRGYDLAWARLPGDGVLVAKRVMSDAWLYEGGRRQRLTSDGRNYSAARSARGDLLVSKLGDDGSVNVWLQTTEGPSTQVTNGARDVEPAFSLDGRLWTYADYARKVIMLCSSGSNQCGLLRKDEMLPSWPRFSPDGRFVAYLTTVGDSRLVVISASDGAVLASWSAYYECPPVWTSERKIWSLEASAGSYFWSEHDAATGSRTGNRKEASTENISLGEVQCWPKSEPPDSPLVPRVRIETEQVSKLLRLSASH